MRTLLFNIETKNQSKNMMQIQNQKCWNYLHHHLSTMIMEYIIFLKALHVLLLSTHNWLLALVPWFLAAICIPFHSSYTNLLWHIICFRTIHRRRLGKHCLRLLRKCQLDLMLFLHFFYQQFLATVDVDHGVV